MRENTEISAEKLHKLYTEQHFTMDEMAKYYNVPERIIYNTVFKAKKENPKLFPYINGRLNGFPCPNIELVKELYTKQNKTAGQIAIQFGVDTPTVRSWISKERYKNPNSIPYRQRNCTHPDFEELRYLYIDKNMSNREISEYYNVDYSRARVWIHCAKRKHPEMFPDKSVRLAKKLDSEKLYRLYIEEDKSTNEIAEIYNVSTKTIRNWLHKCDIGLKERCRNAG